MSGDFTYDPLKRERVAVEKFQCPGNSLQEMHFIPFRSLIPGPGDSPDLGHGREAIIKFSGVPVGFPGVTPGPVDRNSPFTRSVLAGCMILVVSTRRLRNGAHDCLPFCALQ